MGSRNRSAEVLRLPRARSADREVRRVVDDPAVEPVGEPPGRVAHVDGRRVEIAGREEIVLRCGKASLTLRADGKVVLRGVTVVSEAEQVNKIRGGKVQLN